MRFQKLIPVVMSGGAAASPLLTGLIGYWKMDETSGNRLDSVGTRHFTTVVGAVGYATGKIGNCATVDGGINRFYTAEDDTLLAYTWSAGFSVAGWVQVPSGTDFSRPEVLAKGNNANFDWSLLFESQNSPRFYIIDSDSGISTANNTTATRNAAEWYFLCGRYNPSTKKAELVVNAEANALGAALTNGPKNTINTLSTLTHLTSYAPCYADEIGLWMRYLTDEEVELLYNSGNGITYPF